MNNLYDYTYLNANGYLVKFQEALQAPNLDRKTLTKLLKVWESHKRAFARRKPNLDFFSRFKGQFVIKNHDNIPCLYNKSVLNYILQSKPLIDELESLLHELERREIEKYTQQQDTPEDYTPEDSDMEKVSNRLIYDDNYGDISETKSRMSGKDLKTIIAETVRNIITEIHQGQQFSIPFDGNSEPVNFEHFIDYLETIGKYGKINSPKMIEFYNDKNVLRDCGIGSFFFGMDELDEDGFNEFIENFNEKYNSYNLWVQGIPDVYSSNVDTNTIYNYLTPQGINLWDKEIVNRGYDVISDFIYKMTINDKGQIYCERMIILPNPTERYSEGSQDFYDSLLNDYGDSMGVYWSYANGGGRQYYDSKYQGSEVILKGFVNPEDVDWEMTIQLETMDESELRLIPNALVEIDEITYGSKKLLLKSSIIIQA